jgi:hypothetical protein
MEVNSMPQAISQNITKRAHRREASSKVRLLSGPREMSAKASPVQRVTTKARAAMTGDKADPAFSAIEAHKAARAEFERACGRCNALEEKHRDHPATTGSTALTTITLPIGGDTVYRLSSPVGIDAHLKDFLTVVERCLGPKAQRRVKAIIPAARRELVKHLIAVKSAHWKTIEALGIGPAERDKDKACDRDQTAYERLLKTRPTTLEGARAAAAYVLAHERAYLHPDDPERVVIDAVIGWVRPQNRPVASGTN